MGKRKKSLSVVKKKGNNFIELGKAWFDWGDVYHFLLTISWASFFSLIIFAYLILNGIFAIAYMSVSEGINNVRPNSFLDAFSFSVQTMATIGYGAMYPESLPAHTLVAIEVFIGLLGLAMITSLMFVRFSRPTARVLFSKVAVICPYNGVPTLMFRVANLRNNWIVEAQVRVSLLMPDTITKEGYTMRHLVDLSLVRSQTPFLALTWMIMHPINSNSPLFSINQEEFLREDYQIFITLMGFDGTLSQTIHGRHIYFNQDIIWDHHFVDVVKITPDGNRYIDDAKFHDILPI
ncbi:ion channel [Cyanobacterium aponinum]|uniref:ATP-sensitive inward rectifier potassium channel 10 n=2 Tax=Cyanobacterium TaxID=102234 RepID=A0A844GU28_9CHRO|nr:ion channel [Cyanobacterium aponinum]MTF39984.1 ATP-sensitive inward rectifier potassium channel 10 [Cyanobacterium aponinum 0216]PHV62482.1 ATP-sensitive inward rectifier potassium channel 10 [Cyanobacterium aponinum IPPAS B-1201]